MSLAAVGAMPMPMHIARPAWVPTVGRVPRELGSAWQLHMLARCSCSQSDQRGDPAEAGALCSSKQVCSHTLQQSFVRGRHSRPLPPWMRKFFHASTGWEHQGW